VRSLAYLSVLLLLSCGSSDPNNPPPGGGTDGGGGGGQDASTQPVTCDSDPSGATPSATMSFFVTSIGNGDRGGNYGGLSGADARCACLAEKVGVRGKTWRAYLSTSSPVVHARDRIGSGPWFNYAGTQVAASIAELHTTGLDGNLALTETGQLAPGSEHDILTGSKMDGSAHTEFPGNPSAPAPNCANWTSNGDDTYTFVGHVDWNLPTTGGPMSWNASHDTRCSRAGLMSTSGTGRLYCFAQ
jgi:hypothetical protein